MHQNVKIHSLYKMCNRFPSKIYTSGKQIKVSHLTKKAAIRFNRNGNTKSSYYHKTCHFFHYNATLLPNSPLDLVGYHRILFSFIVMPRKRLQPFLH